MLKTVLYPALVVGVFGFQAGLQTVSGDEPDGANVHWFFGNGISSEEAPQAVQGAPQALQADLGALTGNTDSTGENYSVPPAGIQITAITCSSVHMDTPHIVNARVENNGYAVRVRSWAGWDLTRRAGPVWFNCLFRYLY
jgi:hypothetical protein